MSEKIKPVAFTEKQAAQMMQVAEVTLRKWRYAGNARYSRVGRLVRYTLADVEATLAMNRREMKEKAA